MASYSVNATSSAKTPDKDEILMKRGLQLKFADSLKDLKFLRKQLYSAAQWFESSYKKDDHKQFVVKSSREYVTKALVSSVDHLGSVADKLNKFLEEKANELTATIIQFSLIQQRLSTIQGFIYLRGVSHNTFNIEEATKHHKHRIHPAKTSFASGKSTRNCTSSVPYIYDDDVLQKPKQAAIARKMDPLTFSFTRMVPKKEAAGRCSVSPLRFLSGSSHVIIRSVSPTPISVNKAGRWASETGRRAISACRRRHDDMTTKDQIIMEDSYTRRSKHLFRALHSLHHSKNEILHHSQH